MIEISKTMTIEMGHRLPDHEGKCRNLHGHSYQIEVWVRGELTLFGPSQGMVIDFAELKKAMNVIACDFDHKMCLSHKDEMCVSLIKKFSLINSKDSLLDDCRYIYATGIHDQKYVLIAEPPTAEVLAKLWLSIVKSYVPGAYKIEVKETATSKATYQV